MNVYLLDEHHDTDFEDVRALHQHERWSPVREGGVRLGASEAELSADLELEAIFLAMGGADVFLKEVAKMVALRLRGDSGAALYRQEILTDALNHEQVFRNAYSIATEAIEQQRRVYRGYFKSPDSILHSSVELLEILLPILQNLRDLLADHRGDFASRGLATLAEMTARELDDGFFESAKTHLEQLRFPEGPYLSARLGPDARGEDYRVRRPNARPGGLRRLLDRRRALYVEVDDLDDVGMSNLTELRGRGLNSMANAVAQSAEHVMGFLMVLRAELAFYIGCLNLHRRLEEIGCPVCLPHPAEPGSGVLDVRALYDVSLALTTSRAPVGSDLKALRRPLVIITGANQGGKSTFLRAVGQAYVMMQSGMFVGAEAFSATVHRGLFTHFKRREDPAMESGKLDEELERMSRIVDELTPGGLLLCNESFSSTNEREGSEIGRQVIRALISSGVTIFLVTHLFDLASHFYTNAAGECVCLRAERTDEGERTFHIVPGAPKATSHGEDLYREIFAGPES